MKERVMGRKSKTKFITDMTGSTDAHSLRPAILRDGKQTWKSLNRQNGFRTTLRTTQLPQRLQNNTKKDLDKLVLFKSFTTS